MNSRDIMQKYPSEVKETQQKVETMELEAEEDNIWEREARKLYVPKKEEGWGAWTEEDILLIKKSLADAIAKYGAEIFDGDDEERIDIPVFDSPDVATATDDEQDAVVEDPVDVATTDKEDPVDVVADYLVDDVPAEESAQVDEPEEDMMEDEEDPEEEPAVAGQGTGVPEDDAHVPVDAACPNADMDASAVSSSNPLPDNP